MLDVLVGISHLSFPQRPFSLFFFQRSVDDLSLPVSGLIAVIFFLPPSSSPLSVGNNWSLVHHNQNSTCYPLPNRRPPQKKHNKSFMFFFFARKMREVEFCRRRKVKSTDVFFSFSPNIFEEVMSFFGFFWGGEGEDGGGGRIHSLPSSIFPSSKIPKTAKVKYHILFCPRPRKTRFCSP